MPHSLEIDLASFDISIKHGFLPEDMPLEFLPNPYYQPWELIIHNLPGLLKAKCLRARIDRLPILSTSQLHTVPEWRRAYVILSFLTHAYIWEGPLPAQKLPEQITVPFLIVADHFDLPTTASYSATNLWNFAPLTPELSLCNPDHLRCLHTFTGTKDEEWFYMISVAMEACGGTVIPTLMEAICAADAGRLPELISGLLDISRTINELGVLLDRMYEHCRPEVFYHHIRPLLAGSKNMGIVGLPQGVFYDEGDGKGMWRAYCGGSNAQSSLIQLFDAVLGVTHGNTGTKSSKSANYLLEMRRYMPSKHAEFLAYIESRPSLRNYVNSQPLSSQVSLAFNSALASLSNLRDRHILIATRYIVLPSRKIRSEFVEMGMLNLATVSAEQSKDSKSNEGGSVLFGTGGTSLIPFLKQVRNETIQALCA